MPSERLIETLKAVDEALSRKPAHKKRSLRANLEFYKGVVYLALGLPKDFFTATFASRAFLLDEPQSSEQRPRQSHRAPCRELHRAGTAAD